MTPSVLRCSKGEIEEIRAKGLLHMQDNGEGVGCSYTGYLVIATGQYCAGIGVLIQTPPVLKVTGNNWLPIRPAQVMTQVHDNCLAVILHTTIFRQWHLGQLIGMDMELLVIEHWSRPERRFHLDVYIRAGKQGIDRIGKLTIGENEGSTSAVSWKRCRAIGTRQQGWWKV